MGIGLQDRADRRGGGCWASVSASPLHSPMSRLPSMPTAGLT